jgi:hypothetical protein
LGSAWCLSVNLRRQAQCKKCYQCRLENAFHVVR